MTSSIQSNPITKKELLALVEERKLTHVTVAHSDTNGKLRAKRIGVSRFQKSLEEGTRSPVIMAAVSPADDLIISSPLWAPEETGIGDEILLSIAETARDNPFESDGKGLLVLLQGEGEYEELCSRAILDKQVQRLNRLGLSPLSAFEYEFHLYNETLESIKTKVCSELVPIDASVTYSDLVRQHSRAKMYDELLEVSSRMRINIDAFHLEYGAGLCECALEPSEGLTSADDAVIFKIIAKSIAVQNDMMATFMALPSPDQDQGSSGHVHLSMLDTETSKPVFFDENSETGMSEIMTNFLGGLQKYYPEILLISAPNFNSFKRLQPGLWTPLASTWGVENKSAAFRIIQGGPSSQRFEIRVPGADSNPYLVLASILAAGATGIENKMMPGPAIKGNAWTEEWPDELKFPASFTDAISIFDKSQFARENFGNMFVDNFVLTRNWQIEQFNSVVTDWELRMFFEGA